MTPDQTQSNDPAYEAALANVTEACAPFHRMNAAAAPGTGFDPCALWSEYRERVDALVAALTELAKFIPQIGQVPAVFHVAETIIGELCPAAAADAEQG